MRVSVECALCGTVNKCAGKARRGLAIDRGAVQSPWQSRARARQTAAGRRDGPRRTMVCATDRATQVEAEERVVR